MIADRLCANFYENCVTSYYFCHIMAGSYVQNFVRIVPPYYIFTTTTGNYVQIHIEIINYGFSTSVNYTGERHRRPAVNAGETFSSLVEDSCCCLLYKSTYNCHKCLKITCLNCSYDFMIQ